jgi:putative endonuclease
MARMLFLSLFERSIELYDRLAARRGRDDSRSPQHLKTGRRGEMAAFFYLRRKGFVVTARGWRSQVARGDIDLVAWEGDTICFVEVKTRTTRAVAPAEVAVDEDKQRILRRMARHYLRQLPEENVPVRFDILSIYFEANKNPEFELFRGAFGWS